MAHRTAGDIKQYLFVLRQLTGRELKRKYVHSYLGILWSLLNPFLYMLVMTLIFSHMFSSEIEKYPLYYLSGYLIWDMFSQITNQSMTALTDNRTLLLSVKVPANVFVLSRGYNVLVNFGLSLIPFAIMLIAGRVSLTPAILLLPIDAILCFAFSTGLGYILSVLYVFLGDIRYLYGLLLTLWMFISALFYPVTGLPEPVRIIVENNPVYCYIRFIRETAVYGQIPDPDVWIRIALWGICVYLLGVFVFKRSMNRVMIKL